MQVHLDEGTDPWGVKVERVEMLENSTRIFLFFNSLFFYSKDVRLPVNMQRSMAAEAEGRNLILYSIN
jgi:regulator of protease activity HflC (stomatin/prohibitin superfamily)